MTPESSLLEVRAFQAEATMSKKNRSRRRFQSAISRELAQDLLLQLGAEDTEVSKGKSGEPIWPSGFSGSLSHCHDQDPLAAVFVVKGSRLVGIDIEPQSSEKRLERLAQKIFTPQEQSLLLSLKSNGLTAGFSAKESLYKALNPVCRFWFGFLSVEIIEANSTSLSVRLLDQRLLDAFGEAMIPIQWKRKEINSNHIVLTSLDLDAHRYKHR